MASEERDDTDEWRLPVGGGPPTLYDLEQRVEVALSVARAAETAALEIGAASIEAAQQARRAAELAEKASAAAYPRSQAPAQGNGHLPAGPPTMESAPAEPASDARRTARLEPEPVPFADPREQLQRFLTRAHDVSSRLERLQPG